MAGDGGEGAPHAEPGHTTLRNGVSINLLDEALDDRDRAVALMLDQLGWWGPALREARAARPYVS